MRRNITSNQTSVLDNVFSGFPNLFASQERNASNQNQRIYQQVPKPIYPYPLYPPSTPIAQTNLRNQSQNHNPCFHPESTLGWLFGGLKSRDPAPNSYSPETNIYLSQTAIGSENLSKTNQETVRFHV